MSSTRSLYGLLSVPIHGRRFGVFHGLAANNEQNQLDKVQAKIGGFGLPPKLNIGLACIAVDIPSRLLAGWNGVNASGLHRRVLEVIGVAGIS